MKMKQQSNWQRKAWQTLVKSGKGGYRSSWELTPNLPTRQQWLGTLWLQVINCAHHRARFPIVVNTHESTTESTTQSFWLLHLPTILTLASSTDYSDHSINLSLRESRGVEKFYNIKHNICKLVQNKCFVKCKVAKLHSCTVPPEHSWLSARHE